MSMHSGDVDRGKDREDHFLGLLKSFAFRIENA